MVRVVLFILLLALLAAGAAWVADQPGEVAITWLGHEIRTANVLVAFTAVVAAGALVFLTFELMKWLVASPARARRALRERRRRKADDAIARGIVAIGAGDRRSAEKHAHEAARLAPSAPLTLLLTAQTAQLAGDRAAAETAFRAMIERPDTKVLGLRGLHVEAQRRQDHAAARAIVEEAVRVAPGAAWAAQARLDHQCLEGDWRGALESVERQASTRLIERGDARRLRAILLTAQALSLEIGEPDQAKALALEAHGLDTSLVPAAALAGRLLAANGETRKATKVLEASWKQGPHPDIAEAYAAARPGDSTRDRLKRVETLAAMAPDHVESHLSLARTALDAQAFDVARRALDRVSDDAKTQRFCLLMAELSSRDGNDLGRTREWMARALRAPKDAAWTADGQVSPVWLPASPATGKLDAFRWAVPVSELGGPVLAVDEILADSHEPETPAPVIEATPADVQPPGPPPPSEAAPIPEATPTPVRQRGQPTETVFPIERAPDDPGPRAEPRKRFSFFNS